MSEELTAENDAPWDLTPAERVERVPHVNPECDADGCYCPEDVFWRRLLGDADPCAPGKDWAAAAFGTLDDDEREHGEWLKDQQRYEDGCKSDDPPHVVPPGSTPTT